MTVIAQIYLLPSGISIPNQVSIIITNGVPSYFKVVGSGLNQIRSVDWYPKNPTSLKFTRRDIILIDDTEATFMIQVDDNLLDITDRGGIISFQLIDGSTISIPAKTYGPVALRPLWTAPSDGLITG